MHDGDRKDLGDLAVAAGGYGSAVGAERDTGDNSAVALDRGHEFTGQEVPHAGAGVDATSHQDIGLGAERGPIDWLRMSREREQQPTTIRVPDLDRLPGSRGRQPGTITREAGPRDRGLLAV